jgi:xanthine dehydrogenase YagS FAD-binding subunit
VESYPMLSHALLAGASPQLRNRATTGGNLMQRTRCYYFADTAFPACNKRTPGSGCAAVNGFNRIHAILGQTDEGAMSAHTCIATHPSDMCVALYALGAKVEVDGSQGKRVIPVTEFHRLPGDDPAKDTVLGEGELITGVTLPVAKFAKNSWYLKARDRQSYAFALVSVAAGLEMSSGTIKSAGLALGGVAHKPWRAKEAEAALVGSPATRETFTQAAELTVKGAKTYEHNAFKVELAKQCVVKALMQAAEAKA